MSLLSRCVKHVSLLYGWDNIRRVLIRQIYLSGCPDISLLRRYIKNMSLNYTGCITCVLIVAKSLELSGSVYQDGFNFRGRVSIFSMSLKRRFFKWCVFIRRTIHTSKTIDCRLIIQSWKCPVRLKGVFKKTHGLTDGHTYFVFYSIDMILFDDFILFDSSN